MQSRGGAGADYQYIGEKCLMVNEFTYDKAVLRRLETSLSRERLATYHRESGDDFERAARLYTWNTAISAAFYAPLQGLEVNLRNALHSKLAAAYGATWYDNPDTHLSDAAKGHIDRARRDLQRERKPADTPHIVAALSFGFWERLLSHGPRGNNNYEITLWRPALHKAFPQARPRRRQTVHQPIMELRNLRNRIAHHEPIFRRNLEVDHDDILRVLGWICPTTRDWIRHHSSVQSILRLRP